MKYLSSSQIIALHEQVISPNELQGMAGDKSIDAIISRINNRITYGLIEDVFELAACYACYISVGHAFNDANKRTAFSAMDICLAINGIELEFEPVEAGNIIIKAAQNIIDENELAQWLRSSLGS
ncbi:MAG: type II toxin-antitoxin system death-on-curing family toxin [Gammaproteobacteria bacterium]|jgi:death on curing protein|nr:type II toxin-antitoxin system death-on-curing family toxin [Gammaproteobacteria bacterium]MBT6552773.1 type II toxin-antitoxin system death-on-curing family toxin [Gammaproteobacteria bacterium]